MRDLDAATGTDSRAKAINAPGQVVGTTWLHLGPNNPNINHAFRCDGTPGDGGVMHDLGDSVYSSDAYDINDGGFTVGRAAFFGHKETAALWMLDLFVID